MSEKSCATCISYRHPNTVEVCGSCTYPLPEWLMAVSSGGYIGSSPEYFGKSCSVYRDIVEKDDG